MEIRYTTTKPEIFRWYMKRWKHKLWLYHALILAVILFSFHDADVSGTQAAVKPIFIALLYAISAVTFMAAFPLITHKSQERILKIDVEGIKTTMGSKTGAMPWRRVAAVRDSRGYIHITGKNGNEFIVPDRAFVGAADRKKFLSLIRENFPSQLKSNPKKEG